MRVKRGTTTKKKHKKILKQTKGMSHARTSSVKKAKEALLHSLSYAYRDRRTKKRDFRKLWVTRISAACRENGTRYAEFMNSLKTRNIELDRKILADLAATEPNVFKKLLK
ncbi:MAG: 50S ribosomal protein L20 [bacterium]|nr:50S ribosomal protein L20 [bacterium]